MRAHPEFSSPKSVSHARAMQEALRSKLILTNQFKTIHTIAGVDVGYDIKRNQAHASVVTMSVDTLTPQEQVQAFLPVDFPYIPGLLSFREIPVILAALALLKQPPDLLMVDGQGIAHPRRMGIGAHLGVLLDMPSIGVAKSRLTGRFVEPGPRKGDYTPLMASEGRIGTVLRSKEKTNPLFISPGHRIDLETAVALTQRCLTRYRLPEPTRLADKYSKCSPTPLI
jgi:deoxyribonuclease V